MRLISAMSLEHFSAKAKRKGTGVNKQITG